MSRPDLAFVTQHWGDILSHINPLFEHWPMPDVYERPDGGQSYFYHSLELRDHEARGGWLSPDMWVSELRPFARPLVRRRRLHADYVVELGYDFARSKNWRRWQPR